MRYAVIAAALVLAGCGSAYVEAGNREGGIAAFPPSSTLNDAFVVADAHCRQHGRAARSTAFGDRRLQFDCR